MSDSVVILIQIMPVLVLLLLAFFIGRYIEKKHFRSIKDREQEFAALMVRSTGKKEIFQNSKDSRLVSGSVVIGQDYFKMLWFTIISLFGGRMRAYESLMVRARQEALLRLKQEAQEWGADEVVNFRIETANIITNKRKSSGAIEVFTYGTAVKY